MKYSVRLAGLVALWLSSPVSSEQAVPGPADVEADPYGRSLRLYSEAYGGPREIKVSLPGSYGDDAATRYPVLYVLDAESEFSHTVTGVRYLARNANAIPDLIVVGVLHDSRGDEMRPTNPATGDPNTREATFRQYIVEDLVPYIDAEFRTHPYRIVIGHSLGGLFVLNTLRTAPEAFDAYLSSSPALWWQNGQPLEQLEASLESLDLTGRAIYVTTGDEGADSQANLSELSKLVDASRSGRSAWATRSFDSYGHNEVAPVSTYWAIRHLFGGWSPDATAYRRGLEGLVEHYAELSDRFGWNVPVPTDTLLALTFEFARRGDPGDSGEVVELVAYALDQDPCLRKDLGELSDALETQGHREGAQLVRGLLDDRDCPEGGDDRSR